MIVLLNYIGYIDIKCLLYRFPQSTALNDTQDQSLFFCKTNHIYTVYIPRKHKCIYIKTIYNKTCIKSLLKAITFPVSCRVNF